MSTCAVRLWSHQVALAGLVCAALLAGCGDGGQPEPSAPTPQASAPALISAPRQAGELLLRGELSPATHGPIELAGPYRVRFVQYAPEDPGLDFAEQTAFVATLRPARSPRAKPIELFKRAARYDERHLTLDGRYVVEVAFGDYPYAIRFTPDPSR